MDTKDNIPEQSLRDFLVERLGGGSVRGSSDSFRFSCPLVSNEKLRFLVEEYYRLNPETTLTLRPNLMGKLEKKGGWLATINISNFTNEPGREVYGSITVMRRISG